MNHTPTEKELLLLTQAAQAARKNAYAPYSGFRVGAALLTKSGRIFSGSNIENASYSATLCAERAAFSAAVSAGERDFSAILILGGRGDDIASPCYPCGICRQVIREFADDGFSVFLWDGDRTISYTMAELLPHSFGKETLL